MQVAVAAEAAERPVAHLALAAADAERIKADIEKQG
jgi:hypothetical protein